MNSQSNSFVAWKRSALLSAALLAVPLAACDPAALQTRSAPTLPVEVADTMAEIAGVDHRGQKFSLAQARQKGPVAVIFYRGHW